MEPRFDTQTLQWQAATTTVFGSADPVSFAFAIVAAILASVSLMEKGAIAIRKGAVLSMIKGMRLIFPPHAVDTLHLHAQIWHSETIQDYLIQDPALMKLMLKHPCGWKISPQLASANLSRSDYINLSCIGLLDDFHGSTTKIMFLLKWTILSTVTICRWYMDLKRSLSDIEFAKGLDIWFISSLAKFSDSSQEEHVLMEKLACLRILNWNRDIQDCPQKIAWEVPRDRKYTTLWLILAMKEVFGTNDTEAIFELNSTGIFAIIEQTGMTYHLRLGYARLGLWTSYRIWNLEEKLWQTSDVQTELNICPELKCRVSTSGVNIVNGVDTDHNTLFFICTRKDLVNDLLNLIETLSPTQQDHLPLSTIHQDQLASSTDIHKTGTTGAKKWCRCTSKLRASPNYLCCVPACTIFLDGEAAANISNLPRLSVAQIIYIVVSNNEKECTAKLPRRTPAVKQGSKDIVACMLMFEGKVIVDGPLLNDIELKGI